MDDPGTPLAKSKSESALLDPLRSHPTHAGPYDGPHASRADDPPSTNGPPTAAASTPGETDQSSPELPSRADSFSGGALSLGAAAFPDDEWSADEPPPDALGVFDLLDGLALPRPLERWQRALAARAQRQRAALRVTGRSAQHRVVEEWRKRLPTPDERLRRYRRRVGASVARLGRSWDDVVRGTAHEKMSFIAGVLNIFISGYLIGAWPRWFYWWYTAQLLYYMPIRWHTYRQRGYHYFLADLCYFVNFLLSLSIWVAPRSKRLLISTYCLAFGNNAVAIAMWRNSMVFHSLDKMTRYVLVNFHLSLHIICS